jgi:DNA-directed RNA polymerase subunit RPC12/RpoP
MEMVSFSCPHCGDGLEAPSHLDGQTHRCPNCNGWVTLQVVTPKQAAMAGLFAGGLAVLGAIIFGGDD